MVIYGNVWFIHNSTKQHVDFENNRFYLPIKSNKADRIFFDLTLQVILAEADLTLTEEEFASLHKVFYLFLKVNNAFATK